MPTLGASTIEIVVSRSSSGARYLYVGVGAPIPRDTTLAAVQAEVPPTSLSSTLKLNREDEAEVNYILIFLKFLSDDDQISD